MIVTNEPITKEQRYLFQRILNTTDLEDISKKHNISYTKLFEIIFAKEPLTHANTEIMYAIIAKCFEKSEDAITYFAKVIGELKQMRPL